MNTAHRSRHENFFVLLWGKLFVHHASLHRALTSLNIGAALTVELTVRYHYRPSCLNSSTSLTSILLFPTNGWISVFKFDFWRPKRVTLMAILKFDVLGMRIILYMMSKKEANVPKLTFMVHTDRCFGIICHHDWLWRAHLRIQIYIDTDPVGFSLSGTSWCLRVHWYG